MPVVGSSRLSDQRQSWSQRCSWSIASSASPTSSSARTARFSRAQDALHFARRRSVLTFTQPSRSVQTTVLVRITYIVRPGACSGSKDGGSTKGVSGHAQEVPYVRQLSEHEWWGEAVAVVVPRNSTERRVLPDVLHPLRSWCRPPSAVEFLHHCIRGEMDRGLVLALGHCHCTLCAHVVYMYIAPTRSVTTKIKTPKPDPTVVLQAGRIFRDELRRKVRLGQHARFSFPSGMYLCDITHEL